MNKSCIVGRLVRDPEMRYSTGENATAFTKFTVAVNRKFKNKEGNYDADFISCTAFGKTAEFIGKYFNKGNMIGLTGEIRTGSYTNKEGVKVYTTDVAVNEVEFVEGKNKTENHTEPSHDEDIFQPVDDEGDETLPF